MVSVAMVPAENFICSGSCRISSSSVVCMVSSCSLVCMISSMAAVSAAPMVPPVSAEPLVCSCVCMVPSCHAMMVSAIAMSFTGSSEDTRVVLLSAGSLVSAGPLVDLVFSVPHNI